MRPAATVRTHLISALLDAMAQRDCFDGELDAVVLKFGDTLAKDNLQLIGLATIHY